MDWDWLPQRPMLFPSFNVMWLFSLYRRVLYFWIAYSQVRANLYDNIFPLDIRHCNSNTMYIYKRPYVHFPTIFLRQNCDHMCIIKIVFNPLPMKIFWKKLLCIFSFWKIKKVLCILLKSVFYINFMLTQLCSVLKTEKNLLFLADEL